MARVAVVGAGPIGLFCAMSLARRGRDVVCIDCDRGPAMDGTWRRAGVMQFDSPHFFRPAVRNALLAELPDVWEAIVAVGGEPRVFDGLPQWDT